MKNSSREMKHNKRKSRMFKEEKSSE